MLIDAGQGHIEGETKEKLEEMKERWRCCFGGRAHPALKDRTVIIVDRGIATGATLWAAIADLRHAGVARLVAVVPVAPRDTAGALQSEVNELVCLFVPKFFDAVGSFYEDCSQTPDETVIAFLDHAMKRQAADTPCVDQAMEYEKAAFFS